MGTIVYTIAIQPAKIVAELTPRFASRERVDYVVERLDGIEIKLDKVIDLVSFGR